MTSNPTLNSSTFTSVSATSRGETMTIQGTTDKTAILLVLATVAAGYVWHAYFAGQYEQVAPLTWGGAIAGFVLALITSFKKTWSPVTAPIYAICEGLFIGGISAIYEERVHGITLQAVMLTFGTLAALLAAYKMRLITASDNFKRGVVAATGGIALLYITTMILGFFGIHIPAIYGNGAIGIGFSVFVVILAAANLVINFDFIEQGAQVGAPKYMEWYGAFAMLVTLVWLYLEILRLLAKLNRRN